MFGRKLALFAFVALVAVVLLAKVSGFGAGDGEAYALPPPPPGCGAPNQSCCASNVCGPALTCNGGKCVTPPAQPPPAPPPPPPCGAASQTCCAGNACTPGLSCLGNKCWVPAPVRAACNTTSGPPCVAIAPGFGGRLSNVTCASNNVCSFKSGGACLYTSDCAAPLTCQHNMCTRPPSGGEAPKTSPATRVVSCSAANLCTTGVCVQGACRTEPDGAPCACSNVTPPNQCTVIGTTCPTAQTCTQPGAGGVCRYLGGYNQPCRAGTCDAGAQCRNEVCIPVGYENQPCRTASSRGGRCNAPLTCQNDVCRRAP